MLALTYHLLYLRSRLGQTSYDGFNVVPLYIEEQFIKPVGLDTPCGIVNRPLSREIFCPTAKENTKV